MNYQSHNFVKQIHLLNSIKGIGTISVAILMCKIGDFSVFIKPKQVICILLSRSLCKGIC